MSPYFDIVVAGAGPAGLAAAILGARAGRHVLVIDPHPAGPIDKACGEGIMPGGVEALARLGIRPAGRPFVGIRYSLAGLEATGNFPTGTGLGVRRTVLSDALLERAAAEKVSIREGRVADFTQHDGGVTLADGTRTRWLVAADGLRSPSRRALGLEKPSRRLARFGLRRHYQLPPWSRHVEVHLAPGVEAYVTPVADDLVGIAVLFRELAHETHGAAARYDALLARFPELAARLANAAPASAVRGAGPFEQRVARRSAGRVILVGDAAGYLDPLTGEGVALGLATAEAAIDAIQSGDLGSYERRYRALTRRYFVMTSALLGVVERPLLHRPFVRAARAVPSLFDRALGALSHLPDAQGFRAVSMATSAAESAGE